MKQVTYLVKQYADGLETRGNIQMFDAVSGKYIASTANAIIPNDVVKATQKVRNMYATAMNEAVGKYEVVMNRGYFASIKKADIMLDPKLTLTESSVSPQLVEQDITNDGNKKVRAIRKGKVSKAQVVRDVIANNPEASFAELVSKAEQAATLSHSLAKVYVTNNMVEK